MSMATTVLKAEQYSVVNIKWKWDTDGDEELFDMLLRNLLLIQIRKRQPATKRFSKRKKNLNTSKKYMKNGQRS